MRGRFDYVKYDETSVARQAAIKQKFEEIEALCEQSLPNGREKSLVMTKLEESYMWTGKALRNEQIARDMKAQPQEERKNG